MADSTATTKIIIRNYYTCAVLFEYQPTAEQQASGLAMRAALEAATQSGADLRDADLSGADLSGADLICADLRGADLSGADLSGADLSGAVLICADLSGAVLSDAVLRGAALRGAALRDAVLRDAVLSGADLRGVVLRDADLRGADLSDAVLRDADLRDADLRGAVLRGEDVPMLPNIHQQVYAAASQPGALNMSSWHCGTAHCRAGWVVTLADEAGKALEGRMGTAGAAMAIYLKSDPERWGKDSDERLPNFYCGNDKALEDMKRLAEDEARQSAGASS